MSDTKKTTVTLINTFPAASRVRAGIQFVRGETKTLELTKDQVEAFKNDPYFTLGKSKATAKSGNAGESESSVSDTTTADEANDTTEDQGSEDQGAVDTQEDAGSDQEVTSEEDVADEEEASDDAENASDEDVDPLAGTDDEILQANSRDELEALAVTAGVENPASFKDKPKLLAAIREKQAVQE